MTEKRELEFLTADNCALLLIDHQTGTMLGVQDIRLDQFRSNVLALANIGKVHSLPTVLTASYAEGPNGPLMPELFELYWAHPVTDPTQLMWHDTIFTIFAGKSFALLALCFGVSFFIIMDRAAKRGTDFTGRFLWRLALRGGMGVLHHAVIVGVDRDIGVHVTVTGVHVQRHEQAALEHSLVDAVDLRANRIKGASVENLHQRLADFLLP